jgi:hypothetical protein
MSSSKYQLKITDVIDEIIDEKVVIFYVIEVLCKDLTNKKWIIKKRYSEFKRLYNYLKDDYDVISSFNFPSKERGGPIIMKLNHDKILVRRRQIFSNMLLLIISMPVMPTVFAKFLNMNQIESNYSFERQMLEGDTRFLNELENSKSPDDNVSEITNSIIEKLKKTQENRLSINKDNDNNITSSSSSSSSPLSTNKETSTLTNRKNMFFSKPSLKSSHENNSEKEEINDLPIESSEIIKSYNDIEIRSFITTLLSVILVSMIYNFYYISYVIYYFSFEDTLLYLHTNIYYILSLCKLIFSVLLVVLFFTFGIHRVLGYWLGVYLRRKLSNNCGSYLLNFEWLSFRLGMDRNEIVIYNFVWDNPEIFIETPCFLKVKQILIRFDINSIYNAIRYEKPIIVEAVEVDNCDIYIEKATGSYKNNLNLWSAIGATNSDDELDIQEKVINNIRKYIFLFSNLSEKFDEFSSVNMVSKLTKNISNKIVNNNYKKKSNNIDDSNTNDDVNSLDESSSDDDSSNDYETNRKTVFSSNSSKKKINTHLGVKFTFFIDIITLRNIHLYASDLLDATHCSSTKNQAIKVTNMSILKRSLSKKSKKCDNTRRSLYLDEFVWKIVGKILNELFINNKVSMTIILSGAFANNSKAVVQNLGKSIGSGLSQTAYSLKTTELYKNTKKNVSTISNLGQKNLKYNKTELIIELGIKSLQIHLISARDLMDLNNKEEKVLLYCLIHLKKQFLELQLSTEGEIFKSNKHHNENIVKWDEKFEYKPICTFDSIIHIGVYENDYLNKDSLLCSIELKLKDIFIDNNNNFLGLDKEKIRSYKLINSNNKINGEIKLGFSMF